MKLKPTKAKAEASPYPVFSLSGQRLDMPPAPKRTTVKEVPAIHPAAHDDDGELGPLVPYRQVYTAEEAAGILNSTCS